ncbi:hypothetical protein [Polaribacter sp. HaHaR_3_91]|uniref:hypothetical protein n=1 Tax=Polaribacter sp. HaHaR_3_91 TaxID=2745561 RepID=UPI001C4F3A8C|nr:hypothetical protein [Polaribacter sp. HaHaR_3_91]QXP62194.1 hypothetical protein H0I27_09865 [Polaribacter sp. HaHaR_3_91]
MKFIDKTKTFYNLTKIVTESYKWRATNLSDSNQKDIKFTFFSFLNVLILFIALVLTFLINKISESLLNGLLNFTTIFATLIIPVIIMVYDKFNNGINNHLSEIEQKSKYAENRILLHKNFVKRFIFTTLENVFIAFSIITLILIYNFFFIDYLKLNISDYTIQNNITKKGILLFLKLLFTYSLKTIFIFIFLKFIWFLFYSIGALGDFFQEDLSKD